MVFREKSCTMPKKLKGFAEQEVIIIISSTRIVTDLRRSRFVA